MAFTEVNCFLTCPYGPSCFNRSLLGLPLNWMITSTSPLAVDVGISGEVFCPAKARVPAVKIARILIRFRICPFLTEAMRMHLSDQTKALLTPLYSIVLGGFT